MNVIAELGLPPLPEPLPLPIVDSHTHLFFTEAFSHLPVVASLDLAASVGVSAVVEVGCDVASSQAAVELARRDERVVAAVAMHPNDAARTFLHGGRAALEAELEQLAELVVADTVRAVGETGLDYYRTRDAEAQAVQAGSFARHIEWARDSGKTLVIHNRDAHADILKVMDQQPSPERVVMHCFSGDAAFALECVDRGYWLSYPGVVTFGTADPLREAAKVTPVERILVETDAPYLTPRPVRGKPNAPYLLPHTVRFLAELLDLDLAEFCDQITTNTHAAFGGSWGPA